MRSWLPETETEEAEEEYEVEKIVDTRRLDVKKQREYLVKWVNYSEEYNTWEPVDHLERSQELLYEFRRKKEFGSRLVELEQYEKEYPGCFGFPTVEDDRKSDSDISDRGNPNKTRIMVSYHWYLLYIK